MNTTNDKKWIDELILELRLRDVSGAAIGAAVAEVESHLAETGEQARDAFGDPRTYAQSLRFPETADAESLALLPMVVQTCAFAVGWVLIAPAAGAALRGEATMEVSWGALGAALAIMGGTGVFAAALSRGKARLWLLGTILALAMTAAVASQILVQATAFTAPSLAVALVLGAAFIGATVWTNRLEADLVTDPVSGQERNPEDTPRAAAAVVSPWFLLIAMALLIVVEWQTGAL